MMYCKKLSILTSTKSSTNIVTRILVYQEVARPKLLHNNIYSFKITIVSDILQKDDPWWQYSHIIANDASN